MENFIKFFLFLLTFFLLSYYGFTHFELHPNNLKAQTHNQAILVEFKNADGETCFSQQNSRQVIVYCE